MTIGNEPLGEIATNLLFENEKVKIWNLIVDPGESSDWHLHERDYVTIVVEGVGLKVEYDDGRIEDSRSETGTWRYHGEHQTHRVHNGTDERYVNVLVEIKK